MAGYVRKRCPVCQTATLLHCASTTCPWWRCPREACRALIYYRGGIGFQRLAGGVVKSFRIDTPAGD